MNRSIHVSALTGGLATAVAVGILAVNVLWPSAPMPGAAAEVTPFTTSQTVTSTTASPAPVARDAYTVTAAAPTAGTSTTPTATTAASSSSASAAPSAASSAVTEPSGSSAAQEALLCTAGEEAIPSGDGYTCGPADLADPTIVPALDQPAPAPDPVTPAPTTPDTRPFGAGVPAGVKLTVVSGDQTITTPGAVLDGLDIRGRVIVKAANVTIRNSILRGNDGAGTRGGIVDAMTGAVGLQILDSEIVASVPNPYVNGIMGWNFQLTRVDIHGTVDQVHIAGPNVAIRDSWLHDSLHFAAGVDPNHADGSHDDNIQIVGGTDIAITGNVLSDAYNAAIMIGQDRSVIRNLTITGNRLGHGGCSINIAEKGKGPLQAVTVSDNTFGLNTRITRCGVIAPATTVLAQSGNVYTDGSAVTVRKG